MARSSLWLPALGAITFLLLSALLYVASADFCSYFLYGGEAPVFCLKVELILSTLLLLPMPMLLQIWRRKSIQMQLWLVVPTACAYAGLIFGYVYFHGFYPPGLSSGLF